MSEVKEVTIGVILRPYGLKGMVRVTPTTDDPKRFLQLEEISLRQNGRAVGTFKVERIQLHHHNLCVKFQDLDSREAVETLRGAEIAIPRSDCLPTEDRQYYQFDIVGLTAFTTAGQRIGRVVDVVANPANDIWVIEDDDQREWLVPAIQSVIKEVDLEQQRILIEPMAGLLDDL